MTVLAIPDPRTSPVPAGWLEHEAAPAILASEWEALDEYEARLRAFSSYIASFQGDAVEYEKALRLVEKRRGDLIDGVSGLATRGIDDDSSASTHSRWRKIAAHWEEVWPAILQARSRGEVTQAAVLRRIDGAVGEVRVCECCGRRL